MTEAPISSLRRRMIEDMTIRKFAPRTQEGYIRAVKGLVPSSAPRPTGRALKICAATSCICIERYRRTDHQPHRDGASDCGAM